MKRITIEWLRESHGRTAQIWRMLGDRKLSEPEIRNELDGLQVQHNLERLVRGGWLKRSGGGGARDPYRFMAIENTMPEETPGRRRSRICREMTALSRLAHKSRYSALASNMGAALADIEERLRRLRSEFQ